MQEQKTQGNMDVAQTQMFQRNEKTIEEASKSKKKKHQHIKQKSKYGENNNKTK